LVIAMTKAQAAELVYLFVVDVSFLDQLAAPMVVDIERRLEDMGRFELSRAKERARGQGVRAEAIVRRGRLRSELIEAAAELRPSLIVLGRPHGRASFFEEETLRAFADALQEETRVEVIIA
jgi:nucleotide-binding universal stress UspA family protein